MFFLCAFSLARVVTNTLAVPLPDAGLQNGIRQNVVKVRNIHIGIVL